MSIAIVVPARLNSQRLPNKQLLPIGDSNMFEIACKKLSVLSAEYETAVLVYDDDLIRIAEKYPHIKIIKRSKHSTEVDGPWNVIYADMKNVEADTIMVLNPCLIFVKIDTIRKAILTFENSGATTATSVKPFNNWLYTRHGSMLIRPDMTNLSTKHIRGYYEPAHVFHICNKDLLVNKGIMLEDNHALIGLPRDELIDIDTLEDYEFAKWKYEK